MRCASIDPRDITSEVDAPAYRVHFWDAAHSVQDEWRVWEADVPEVLAWAAASARGRAYVILVEVPAPDGVCLVRLSGCEGPRADAPPSWVRRG